MTHERVARFRTRQWAELAQSELVGIAAEHEFSLDAYCVMPDHVHVLLAGLNARSSLPAFAHRFKQSLGFRFKQATGEPLWQRSYHDHVIRPDEPWQHHARYILENPVRAGLAQHAGDRPFSGPPLAFDDFGQV